MQAQRPVLALVCEVIYPYSRGGREIRYRELLPQLAKYAEIHVYTMQWWEGPRVYTDQGITYHAITRLLPLYKGNRRSFRQALHFGIGSLRLLRSDFDVLEVDHIPYTQVFILRAVATLKRTPLTVTWHEVWSRSYWCDYLGWAGWLAWAIESLAMRLPDHIIAASSQTADRLAESTQRRIPITTIPNGINLSLIRATSKNIRTTDLISVGRLIEHKRIDTLLDAIAQLKLDGPEVTCRIVGDGPARADLEQRARSLGIDKSVEFCHDIGEQTEIYSMIKASRLFLSLSSREGFGMAVLEAIACGVPVLTTESPDNLARHLVAMYSRGTICAPTTDAVVNAIKAVLSKESNNEPALHTDSWVADYDWEAVAKRMSNVYLD